MLSVTGFLCCIFLLVFTSKCSGKSYCKTLNCKNNNDLCKFQHSDVPAKHCIGLETTITTEHDKIAILDKLNSRRNKVASGEIRSLPAASNMQKLEWNTKLEVSAQRWANQCVHHEVPDVKDACRHLDDVRVGQNIATVVGDSPGLLPTALVDVWYMELLTLNVSILKSFQSSSEGGPHHDYFTQLVWSDSTEVGCAGVKFQERSGYIDGGRNRTVYRLICNFAPSGNIENQSVYSQGPPCSKCRKKATCDAQQHALCTTNTTKIKFERETPIRRIKSFSTFLNNVATNSSGNVTKSIFTTSRIVKTDTTEHAATTTEPDDGNITPFDYFSHLHDFTRQMITLATKNISQCKNILAVDDFIEILRNKLSSDTMFKNLLLSTKAAQGTTENTFTDESVNAFINKIYSKKEVPTTTRNTESDLLNSTLLVDLVEAVIFRSGDKVPDDNLERITQQSLPAVVPIKIQAEFGLRQQNTDLTGHYFFPEEVDEGGTTASSDTYYDNSNLPISDVLMEIEDIRKFETKNFLDEILDLESSSETTTSNLVLSPDDMNAHKSGHEVMKKFLEEIKISGT